MASDCTPFWHRWCPNCGDCTCPDPIATDNCCPLHGTLSEHDVMPRYIIVARTRDGEVRRAVEKEDMPRGT